MINEARKSLMDNLPFGVKRAALTWKHWQEEARKQINPHFLPDSDYYYQRFLTCKKQKERFYKMLTLKNGKQ